MEIETTANRERRKYDLYLSEKVDSQKKTDNSAKEKDEGHQKLKSDDR